MFPLQDVNVPPRRLFPFVMWLIVIVNVVVFIKEITLPTAASNCFVLTYSFDPAVLTHHAAAPDGFAQACRGMGFPPIPSWATIVTAMFLHASLLHIGGNMLFFVVFGDNIEDRLGHLGFLAFYLVCGVIAALAQTFADPTANLPNLGASGAIAGVMGAYLLLYPGARIHTLFLVGILPIFASVPAILLILFWFGLQLFNGYATLNPAGAMVPADVAYFAHVGGFIAGFLITLLLKPWLPDRPLAPRYPRTAAAPSRAGG